MTGPCNRALTPALVTFGQFASETACEQVKVRIGRFDVGAQPYGSTHGGHLAGKELVEEAAQSGSCRSAAEAATALPHPQTTAVLPCHAGANRLRRCRLR